MYYIVHILLYFSLFVFIQATLVDFECTKQCKATDESPCYMSSNQQLVLEYCTGVKVYRYPLCTSLNKMNRFELMLERAELNTMSSIRLLSPSHAYQSRLVYLLSSDGLKYGATHYFITEQAIGRQNGEEIKTTTQQSNCSIAHNYTLHTSLIPISTCSNNICDLDPSITCFDAARLGDDEKLNTVPTCGNNVTSLTTTNVTLVVFVGAYGTDASLLRYETFNQFPSQFQFFSFESLKKVYNLLLG